MKVSPIICSLLMNAFFSSIVFAENIGNNLYVGSEKEAQTKIVYTGMNLLPGNKFNIKNSPYSAEVVVENKQVIEGGNILSSKEKTMTFRDSQGRTRDEKYDRDGNIMSILITDSVENIRYILTPSAKTASKYSMTIPRFNLEIKDENLNNNKIILNDKKSSSIEKEEKIIVLTSRVLSDDSNSNLKNNEFSNVEVIVKKVEGSLDLSKNVISNFPKLHLSDWISDSKWRANGSSKVLESKEVEGVKAEGTLFSFEIPAGEIGNSKSIVITEEIWKSPELQITLYSRIYDPRKGENIYRLSKLKRQDIPASLFEVPSDYKVTSSIKLPPKLPVPPIPPKK